MRRRRRGSLVPHELFDGARAPPLPVQTYRIQRHESTHLQTLWQGRSARDTPRPTPKPDEILVQVHAAGLNPIDNMIPKGMFKPILRLRRAVFGR